MTGNGNTLYLNSTDPSTASNIWNATDPTSTVFSFASNTSIPNTNSWVFYCWTEDTGYSSMGTYTGGESTPVPVTCGFEPLWIMIKQTSSGGNWLMYDQANYPNTLEANNTGAQYNSPNADISYQPTGFTVSGVDLSFGTYSYIAFGAY